MRNYLTFGSFDSRNFGVYIGGEGTYNAPARVYNTVSVPGRNGDLLFDQKKFENIEVIYPAFIAGSNFKANITAFRSALMSASGYVRITDTYHPEEYRLGYFAEAFEVEARSQNDGGTFEIVFRCKPQRFLTSGETTSSYTANGSITNPTLFESRPLIKVTGYGTLTIGSEQIVIANRFSYVNIDSDIQDCYYGAQNANSVVTFNSNNFPVLKPGVNNFTKTANISKIEITPRWFRI